MIASDLARAHYLLRTAVYNRMYEWDPSTNPNRHPKLLADLINRGEFTFSPLDPMSDASVRACEALLGEHGYVVYKMLLARIEHG
jgi:hypothetical protein